MIAICSNTNCIKCESDPFQIPTTLQPKVLYLVEVHWPENISKVHFKPKILSLKSERQPTTSNFWSKSSKKRLKWHFGAFRHKFFPLWQKFSIRKVTLKTFPNETLKRWEPNASTELRVRRSYLEPCTFYERTNRKSNFFDCFKMLLIFL